MNGSLGRGFVISTLFAAGLLAAAFAEESKPEATPSPWALPAPGSCQPEGGLVSGPARTSEDAPAALPFEPGDVFALERLDVLKNFLPDFIWPQRERFFFDGMRLEIGPCFRDYSPPPFYDAATETFRGQAKLDADGGLEDYTAGQPFAAADLASEDPMLGNKWLWNVEFRYQAAGFHGKFRMTDLVGRIGRAEPFEGEMFKFQMAHRADRPEDDYVAPGARAKHFVAGGIFFKPFDAREHSWRQFRDLKHEAEIKRSDDLHAYLPQWRRVRRLNANQVEGLYMPSFSVGVVPNQQLMVGSGGGSAGGVGAAGGVGGIGGTVQNKRSGYEGLVFRPLLYETVVLGLHDVLAPINSAVPGYPENEDRDFGPWGLSFASDRWDLRRALVLEMRAKEPTGDLNARQVLYVDLQTLQPLYMATFDGKEEMTNAGLYTGRWSDDREGYPGWPDDETRPVRVIDSVGAAFANLAESGSWRRESWENVATPPPDKTVKRMTSVSGLTRRR
ncbi:MAG: DUF1329 domain-containing protein [bacterium]|nr:DUF1329 domain-containing protein [bacterium]